MRLRLALLVRLRADLAADISSDEYLGIIKYSGLAGDARPRHRFARARKSRGLYSRSVPLA